MTRPSRLSMLGRTNGPAPSDRVATALQTLNDAGAQLRQLRIQHQANVDEIRRAVSEDPNLTAEGRQNTLRERSAAAGERARVAADSLWKDVEAALQAIADVIERNWPAPAAGVEGMLGRQAAWARARTLLDAGMRPTQVIAETDDVETLYALDEELPTWIRARGATRENAEAIRHRIDLRVAQVASSTDATSPTAEVDLMAKFEAAAIVAGLEPIFRQAAAEFAGHSFPSAGQSAAVSAHYARQAITGTFMPIVKPDGSVI